MFQPRANRTRFEAVAIAYAIEKKREEQMVQAGCHMNQGFSSFGGLNGVTFREQPDALPRAVLVMEPSTPHTDSRNKRGSPCPCCGALLDPGVRRLVCGVREWTLQGVLTCALCTRYVPGLRLIACARCHTDDSLSEPRPTKAMLQQYRHAVMQARANGQVLSSQPLVVYRELEAGEVERYDPRILLGERPVRCPVCPRVTTVARGVRFRGCVNPTCVLRCRTLWFLRPEPVL